MFWCLLDATNLASKYESMNIVAFFLLCNVTRGKKENKSLAPLLSVPIELKCYQYTFKEDYFSNIIDLRIGIEPFLLENSYLKKIFGKS